MRDCVPGMQSVDVISDEQYVAHMQVKISFISANFDLNTRIVEQDAPRYLRAEGTGEDSSVASSLTQTSEMFLAETEDGGTDLRIKVEVDVYGRLGTFGLGVMKAKASRMWDEFGTNLIECLHGRQPGGSSQAETATATSESNPEASMPNRSTGTATPPSTPMPVRRHGWWDRLLGRGSPAPAAEHIHVEMQHGDKYIRIDWPASQAGDCALWLEKLMADGATQT